MASVAANAALRTPRSLRVIALPLTRAPHQLTYYHFVNPPSTISKNANSLVNRTITKALDVWAGFGKAEEGSWKVRRPVLFPVHARPVHAYTLMVGLELTQYCS